ncbi:conserved hypothetical protein [Candidatus Protochlamydia naegleriophila]|uniref:Secreted protein n=1 Tax=Candidatus Protochlamydia naegleriophila TaxID=389348 RepID=A0A0U5ERR7_9BACT|nr:hypothetical protein [Candidatus Protochlamydia naegleriophila]CUI16833.1 conserved hypothetical protein [Candidatus Protochlamydia naegleriophila]
MRKLLFAAMMVFSSVGLVHADSSHSDFHHHHSDLFDASQSSQTYRVRGFNPFTQTTYTGIVTLTRAGEIFAANWLFDDGTSEIGTGFLENGQLSFVFSDAVNPLSELPGVQVYEIHRRHLKGHWTILGQALVGEETLTRID